MRFLTFIRSCRDSNKKCLSTLINRACKDQGSITKQNLNFIETESDNMINMRMRQDKQQSEHEESDNDIEEINMDRPDAKNDMNSLSDSS